MSRFAVFICTHGRPDRQYTLQTLRKSGYTGKVYLVLDDEDETEQEYRNLYPEDDILMFDKQSFIETSDTGTIENQRKCILYAKNACEEFAKHLELPAFVIADDDILKLRYRYIEDKKLKTADITTDLDSVIDVYVDIMLTCDMAATGFGFAQFYFTGVNSFSPDNIQKYRVPYNFVFRNSKFEVDWKSWFGEDIVTAVYWGRVGQLWTAIPHVQQEIVALASADGGMKDTYDSNSDIRLAMQNVMYLPAELKPFFYKGKFMASIKRENAFPKLISSRYQLS